MSGASKLLALALLGCGPVVKYGTVPRPCVGTVICEVLPAKSITMVWPFPNHRYIALASDGTWCPLDGADGLRPWTIREGDWLICRWSRS